jgi:hypothetical protein
LNESNAAKKETMKDAKLPLRDKILLPVIALLTVSLLLVSTELIARRMFTDSKTGAERCLVFSDASTGVRAIPNCVCWEKKYENRPVEYRFNSSGYRTDIEFGPKQPGTYRIVMIGSSTAMGAEVQVENSFAVLLPAELSKRTGRKVELYNEAIEGWGGTPHNIALRFNKALAVQPDLILWVLSPGDIIRVGELLPPGGYKPRSSLSLRVRVWQFIKSAFSRNSLNKAIVASLDHSRSAFLLRHFLYRSQSLYVRSYLLGDGGKAGDEEAATDSVLQLHLKEFDGYAADIEARAKAAGVPLVATFLPIGEQAALISKGGWPDGYDPYKWDEEMRPIIESHGGIYAGILPDFRNIPNPERGYFLVDGHPNAMGHATISTLLAKELTSGSILELKASNQPGTDVGNGN